MKRLLPLLRSVCILLAYIVFAMLAVWGAGVAFYCIGLGWWGLILYVLILGACIYLRKNMYARIAACVIVVGLTIYYLMIPASNDRDWQASWSQMAQGEINGDTLVLHNVRDFRYRTTEDFDVRYATKTYQLDKLSTLDFIVSHWDGIEIVSHTLLSFGFSDGQHLALSTETRLDKGDVQGAIPGLFKRFELQFIFATEEDIFALRTNYRHEELYLYRIKITDPSKIRAILVDFVNRANESRVHPEFYNTIFNNCTTALRPSLQKAVSMPSSRFDLGAILNGYVDRRAFEKGLLEHHDGENFDMLRKRSLVPNDISKDNPQDYSRRIRKATIYQK